MVRKDYEIIAGVIRASRSLTHVVSGNSRDVTLVVDWIERELSLEFIKDNPRFDTTKFHLACKE